MLYSVFLSARLENVNFDPNIVPLTLSKVVTV